MTVSIRHVEVVIPARDEEQHIDACLRSLRDSAALLRTENAGVTCGVTVVLDRCSDRTGAIAAAASAFAVHRGRRGRRTNPHVPTTSSGFQSRPHSRRR